MKELKLLPENWKGEIDYSKVEFVISPDNKLWVPIDSCWQRFRSDGDSYYSLVNGEPVKLKPEPQPDSIKLSDTDHCHIIIAQHCGDTCRIHPCRGASGNRYYYVEVLHSSRTETIPTVEELLSTFSYIKIYDMTQ